MTYEEYLKLRMIYIVCVDIVLELYPRENANFIERKSKELYELAKKHNPYIENK